MRWTKDMVDTSSFRGIQSIREVRSRMAALVKFYRERRPDVQDVICRREDYDLIRRWPKAAHVEGFAITDNGVFFEGLRLIHDAGPGRYNKAPIPEQQQILSTPPTGPAPSIPGSELDR